MTNPSPSNPTPRRLGFETCFKDGTANRGPPKSTELRVIPVSERAICKRAAIITASVFITNTSTRSLDIYLEKLSVITYKG
jgi:hypothetical protein